MIVWLWPRRREEKIRKGGGAKVPFFFRLGLGWGCWESEEVWERGIVICDGIDEGYVYAPNKKENKKRA